MSFMLVVYAVFRLRYRAESDVFHAGGVLCSD